MNKTMLAMVLDSPLQPLVLREFPIPKPGKGQIRIKILACGICRTDLHVVDGELPHPLLPLIPGHEIIGTVEACGEGVEKIRQGDVVGVPWLAYTCGVCKYCLTGRENLCEKALFTGYTTHGGFATHCLAWEQYCFPLPATYANASGTPLLCAGLIGYRSYRKLPVYAQHIGFFGFGAAAHILVQIARHEQKSVYAFTKPGDKAAQAFALQCGAVWAGDADAKPPCVMDACIIFAPDGALVPSALSVTEKGGAVICAGIHMSNIPAFPYALLWEERSIRSVANLTREDGALFFRLISEIPVSTTTTLFPLQAANEALALLRSGQLQGAAVLTMPSD